MLESGKVATVSELAQKVKQERAFLFRALSLVNLAPDIIEAILNGKEPAALTLSKLRKGFPEDWDEQRKMFGMEWKVKLSSVGISDNTNWRIKKSLFWVVFFLITWFFSNKAVYYSRNW